MGYFSTNLRYLRQERKLSQEALAKLLGLNRGNIASYEKGTAEPNLNNIARMARYFNVGVIELIESDIARRRNILGALGTEAGHNGGAGEDDNEFTGELQEKLNFNRKDLEQFRQRSEEMRKILDGFRQFHKFKMESSEELSEDVQKMAHDYERLMDVLDEVLRSNKNLMDLIDT